MKRSTTLSPAHNKTKTGRLHAGHCGRGLFAARRRVGEARPRGGPVGRRRGRLRRGAAGAPGHAAGRHGHAQPVRGLGSGLGEGRVARGQRGRRGLVLCKPQHFLTTAAAYPLQTYTDDAKKNAARWTSCGTDRQARAPLEESGGGAPGSFHTHSPYPNKQFVNQRIRSIYKEQRHSFWVIQALLPARASCCCCGCAGDGVR
jgi:hypothetical protein